MHATRTTIAITDLSAAILAQTGALPPGGHRRFQQLAADARLPTAHRVSGRWHVDADAMSEILAALKLTTGSQAAAA